MRLIRWFQLPKLTSSIINHLKPYSDEYSTISEEIIRVSTDPSKVSSLKDLQIKQNTLETYHKLNLEFDTLISSLKDLDLLKSDRDMLEAVQEEIQEKELELQDLESTAIDLILEKDVDDDSNVIIEIKPGVGGSESSLFSEDILNMYIAFSDLMNWRHSILHLSADQQINRGVKEAVLKIEGQRVYSQLKGESGVHKVIRVPETEKSGRLHSSTACVIVLPDHPPDSFTIDPKDVKIDVMRARGPGGQHVNKTESAVRATHLPTGLTAQCQDTRSQLQNRELALEVLYARVYDLEKTRKMQERAQEKKSKKGSGDRSEKIRTYNYPQDRITDHRFDFTLHGIDNMMRGLFLRKFIDIALRTEKTKAIEELLNNTFN